MHFTYINKNTYIIIFLFLVLHLKFSLQLLTMWIFFMKLSFIFITLGNGLNIIEPSWPQFSKDDYSLTKMLSTMSPYVFEGISIIIHK